MPHLTVEYTANLGQLQARSLLLELNRTLSKSGEFTDIDIKSRALRLDTWLVGTQEADAAFVHVKLAILSGRTEAVRQRLSGALLDCLRAQLASLGHPDVQACVEMLEIDRPTYGKLHLIDGGAA